MTSSWPLGGSSFCRWPSPTSLLLALSWPGGRKGMVHEILFIIFGLICIAGAVNLLIQRHPINSALSLVVVMMALSLIYLLLGAEFVAAVQVIVYAGAIMVLFVFVIMLLNAGEEERSRGSRIA